jgi:chromosome segregation ATPase
MAFRKITELKNSSTCNLLVMDEIVDSSLDPASREVFMDIILSEGGNYFVISHTSPTMDVFDAVMEVSKVGDFSVYEYLK